MAEVTKLEINIKSNATTAAQSIDKLTASLNRLNSAASGLGKVSTRVKDIATQTTKLGRNAASVERLSRAMNKLGSSSKVSSLFSKIGSESKNAGTAVGNLGLKFTELHSKLSMIIAIGVKIGQVLSGLIDKAGQYIEDFNMFSVALGDYAGAAKEYADKVGDVMGIDPGQWMRYQGTLMTITNGFGVASDKAYLMSKNLTQLTYDLASFYNLSFEDAYQKVTSGISGELEPMRRLGYDLSVARLQEEALALGVNKKVSAMTQAEKAQLRYHAMLTQVTQAQGDMARTLDSPMNQLRIFKAEVEQAARAIGNLFLPMLQAVLPYCIAAAKAIRLVATALASFFHISLPKIDTSGIGSIGDAAGAAEDNMNGATKAAKKLKNTVLGFDELNVLNDPTSGSGGGSGSGAGGGSGMDFDLPEYDFLGDADNDKINEILDKLKQLEPLLDAAAKKAKELWDAFKAGFLHGWGDQTLEPLMHYLDMLKQALKDIFLDPEVLGAASRWADSVAFMLGSLVGSLASIGVSLATNLVGGLATYLSQNVDRIKGYLISMFDVWTEINYMLADYFAAVAEIFQAFMSEEGVQMTANLIGIFADAFMGISLLASKFARDVINIITKPIIDNQLKIEQLLVDLMGVFADVLGTIKNLVDGVMDKANEVYDGHLKPLFDSIADGLSQLLGTAIDLFEEHIIPVLDRLAQKFDEVVGQHVQPMINVALEAFGAIADILKRLWELVLVPLANWIMTQAAPIFAKVLEDVGTVLLDALTLIIDTATLLFTVVRDGLQMAALAIDAFVNGDATPLIQAFSDFLVDIWDGIKLLFEDSLKLIFGITDEEFGAIKETIEEYMNGAKDFLDGNINVDMHDLFDLGLAALNLVTDGKFKDVYDTISFWMNEAKKVVDTIIEGFNKAIQSVKTAISSIKMPSMSSIGSGIASMLNAKGGTFSVARHATGALLTRPTFLGMMGNTAHIGGEAGREALLPLDRNTGWMDEIARRVSAQIDGGYDNAAIYNGVRQGVYDANATQNELLREQNELLRELLFKDTTVQITSGAITSGLARQNLRAGRNIVAMGV